MDICEKIAYIKGLAEGLALDGETKEGKIIAAIIDLLGDITEEICDIEDACDDMSEQIDAVDEDLSSLEDVIYEGTKPNKIADDAFTGATISEMNSGTSAFLASSSLASFHEAGTLTS